MIKPSETVYETQRELIEFMDKFDIKVKLAAKLLGVSVSLIHFYRRGGYAKKPLTISRESLDALKIAYKEYIVYQIESI